MDTWKNKHSHGGGVLRFYGIHVIALLAHVGYNNIIKSKLSLDLAGNPYQWSAIFSGKDVPNINVSVNSRSEKNLFLKFMIHLEKC